MGLIAFIKDVLTAKTTRINLSTYSAEDEQETIAAISRFAVDTAIKYIAEIVSKVEFKTYKDGKEIKGREWYSLNVRPNRNQSSTEFWREVIYRLLKYGKVLIIPAGEQKIIATDFSTEERAIAETTFTDIYRDKFRFSRVYNISEVFYLSYSQFDTSAVLAQIIAVLTKLVSAAADKYERSGGQKGILEIPGAAAGAFPDDEETDEMIKQSFSSYFKAKNAVMPLRNGTRFDEHSSASTAKASNEVSDIKNLIDEAVTIAAQGLTIPPQLLIGSVTGSDDALNLLLTSCIDPLINCISEEFSGKEFSPEEYLRGNYIEADSTNIKHFDIFSQAVNVDKLIGSGYTNIDELRGKSGLKETGEPWAKKHYITKNYALIENMNSAEGGG